MPFQRQNYFQRRTKPKGPKANEMIRSPQVQVISSDGKNLGTVSTKEAIQMARHEGLDLIEISPNANPPVCRIIDIGKHKYDLQKKANKAKKKQKIVNLKEIKLKMPLLVSVSNKSFIGKILKKDNPADRLAGSLTAEAVCVLNGADIIRTHNVAETKEAVAIATSHHKSKKGL